MKRPRRDRYFMKGSYHFLSLQTKINKRLLNVPFLKSSHPLLETLSDLTLIHINHTLQCSDLGPRLNPQSPLQSLHSSPQSRDYIIMPFTAQFGLQWLVAVCSPKASGSETTAPYNTLSAEEGGYVNMWLHTCNNTLSSLYTHCHTPVSHRLAESAFYLLA